MATTDARPGFKLPWSADRNESDPSAPDDAQPQAASDGDATSADPWGFERASTPAPVAPDAAESQRRDDSEVAVVEAPRRKPNKLMADLTRAMQTAAQSAREETLARLQSDAKAYIEEIHAGSGTEATDLRRQSEEEIAGIRDWSKAEIARIREETESRITERKSALEREIEAHAARIEQRIERVQVHVGRFEAEMQAFFEKLLAEDDPTHLAAMAENLPEPPSFEDDPGVDYSALVPAQTVEVAPDLADEAAPDASHEDAPDAVAEPVDDTPAEATVSADESESAFAAIQAAAEAAEAVATDDPGQAEDAPADESEESVESAIDPDDPRVAALGLTPEAAAEAEAEAAVDVNADGEEIATFSDDALAARLAGLVPGADEGAPRTESQTTRVVVTGLVSVASIAGFKRQLGRLEGVASVGVSSGPDGEFIFAVAHTPNLALADAVATLEDFGTQVTGTTDDAVSVAARDPETAA